MNRARRGFALLVALWFIVAIATLLAVALADASLGARAAMNRLALSRAAWARDACIAILQAHYDYADPLRGVDSVDLGRGAWCSARATDPSARLNINRASREQLRIVLGSDSLADALLDWRDADDVPRPSGAESGDYTALGRPLPSNHFFGSTAELRLVRGFERASLVSLDRDLTVDGDGMLNVSAADPVLVSTMPGLKPSDAILLREAMAGGWRARSVEDLLAHLGDRRRAEIAPSITELRSAIVFRPPVLVIDVFGAIDNGTLRARATLTAVVLPERLAIVRRVLW